MKIIIKNAHLFDPSENLDNVSDLLIENEKIIGIGKNLSSDSASIYNMEGKTVFPGFMDMHVHLREPGREDKETIGTGCKAASQGGFTAIACMPNTNPPLDDVSVLHYVLNKSKNAPVKVYPTACVSKGQKGEEITEMGKLAEEGAVAFSDDGKPVKTAELMRRAMEYSKLVDKVIIDHNEEETLAQGVMHEGYYSTLLGLKGIPSECESIAVARNILLAELTGGKYHAAHLSSAKSVDLIRKAKEKGLNVTAEVTIHHLLLTHESLTTYDANYKINPPLRTEKDREALIKGVQDGTIGCIVSDHAPHTREEKEMEFDLAPFGISGVEILIPLLFSELILKGKISLKKAVEALSYSPYKILGLAPPRIKINGPADLTILDLKAAETIRVSEFKSKGKNSPYDGKTVTGIPVMTVVNGKIEMEKTTAALALT
jgi:dihydroorotase